MPASFTAHQTFVPNFDASGKLVVAFSRNIKDFPINKWITLTPVKQLAGYYLRIVPENAARIVNAKVEDSIWPDGQPAPIGQFNTEVLDWKQFVCFRYVSPYAIGKLAVDSADFDVMTLHQRQAAQQRMTGRAQLVFKKLVPGSQAEAQSMWLNHWAYGPNTANLSLALKEGNGTPAGGTNPGNAYNGDAFQPNFKKILQTIAVKINQDTFGVVSTKNLCVVVNPNTAVRLSQSAEVHAYLKESPYALAQIRGDEKNQNAIWGLPERLYGFEIVVDDTVMVGDNPLVQTDPNKSPFEYMQTKSYVLPDNALLVVAKPNSLVSPIGPNFSTATIFAYEEMVVEEKYDEDNRLYRGRVIDTIGVELTAPVSGYFVKDISYTSATFTW